MFHRPSLTPKQLFVAEVALEDPLTQRILSRLPDLSFQIIPYGKDPLRKHSKLSDGERISLGKTNLEITHYKGTWLKPCPGTLQHICCNLFVINPYEGCPFDCTYCALQSYLHRNPTLKIFSNTAEMLGEIEQTAQQQRNKPLRICTGELGDSLVWDSLTDLTLELVPFFARFPNLILELKTKDNFINNLLQIPQEFCENTIVSFSVNAPTICKNEELYTASLSERLIAAKRLQKHGYRIGLHFDPVIFFENWQEEYRHTVSEIFKHLDYRLIAWISIAVLRYPKAQHKIMMERFPESSLPFSEQFIAIDKKLRIIQPIRVKMLRFLWCELKNVSASLPVYMCMESAAVWQAVTGGVPSCHQTLNGVFG